MSKGGSTQKTNQTASQTGTESANTSQAVNGTSTTTLDPRFADLVYGNAGAAQSLFGQTYQPYTGALGTQAASLVGAGAGYTPQEITAGTYIPQSYNASPIADTSLVKAATIGPAANASASTGASLMGAYQNPFTQDVVNSTIQSGEQARRLADINNNSRAVAAGAFGGDRAAVAQGVLDAQNLKDTTSLVGNLNLQGFNTAAQLGMTDADRATSVSQANAAAANQNALAQANLTQSASTTNAAAENTRDLLYSQMQTGANAANAGAANSSYQFNLGQNQQAQQLNQAAGLQGAGLGLQGGSILGGFDQNQFGQGISIQQLVNQALGLKGHPLANFGLSAAGGALNPLSLLGGEFIGAAPSLLGVVGRSAAVGAGTGALAGYTGGRGGLLDGSRTTGAVEGGALGAAAGTAIPLVGAAAGGTVDALTGRSAQALTAARQQADTALNGIGTSVADLPQLARTAIDRGAARGADASDLAIQEAARVLPVPVPLSRGQITGDPAQQLTENMILRGARGAGPSRQAQLFKQDQQAALRGNVNQIGADMAGGFGASREQAGAAVSDALNGARDRAWSGVNDAYDAARAAPEPAYLGPSSALALTRAARGGLTDFDPIRVPAVAREVDRLDGILTPWAKSLPPGVNPDRVSGLSGDSPADVRSIFDSRARLTRLRASNDPVEAAAAGSVVSAIDGHIDKAVTEDLFQGDPASVQLWRNAIGARSEFGKTFQANDLVSKLTARQPGAPADLAVDPHDAANYIFGRSAIGWVGRQNLYRGLNRVKGVLGEGSDAWNQLRSAAFSQIAKAGDGPMEAGSPQFSGAGFAQAWNKAKSEDGNLLATMFSPEERGTIDRFAGVASRATKPVTGGDNASNSGITAARAFKAMRRLPFVTVESIPFIDHFADKIDAAAAGAAIRRATYGAKPRQLPPRGAASTGRYLTPATAAAVGRLPMLPDRGDGGG